MQPFSGLPGCSVPSRGPTGRFAMQHYDGTEACEWHWGSRLYLAPHETRSETLYIYICIYIYVCMYVYAAIHALIRHSEGSEAGSPFQARATTQDNLRNAIFTSLSCHKVAQDLSVVPGAGYQEDLANQPHRCTDLCSDGLGH